jgi:hypothetical protein
MILSEDLAHAAVGESPNRHGVSKAGVLDVKRESGPTIREVLPGHGGASSPAPSLAALGIPLPQVRQDPCARSWHMNQALLAELHKGKPALQLRPPEDGARVFAEVSRKLAGVDEVFENVHA